MNGLAMMLEDFSGGSAAPVVEAVSIDDLEAARSNAYAAGYAEGEAAGLATAKDAAAALDAMQKAVDKALAPLGARFERQVCAVLGSTMKTFAPAVAQAAFAGALADFARSIASVATEGGVELRVPPDRYEQAAALLAGAEGADAQRLRVVADHALSGAVAKAEWRDGGADLDIETPLAALIRTINPETK